MFSWIFYLIKSRKLLVFLYISLTCTSIEQFPYFCAPFVHWQVLIEITEASSVITWDFEVCKSDAVFNIYHSKKFPQALKKDTVGNLTAPGSNSTQVIEKAWVLGKDYSLVETGLICREGESIQVTTDVASHALTFFNRFC